MLPESLKKLVNGFSIRLIGLMLVAVMLVLVAWETGPKFIAWWNAGDGGIVIVDSPEVYSRERLINDRFRQVSWLEKELENSDTQFFGNQAITDLRQIWGLKASIGTDKPNTLTADEADANATSPEKTAKPENENTDLSVTPIERFRDVLAYREEIRTEMMETLLDDRHDIKGNTLYRLKFDTTVLPEENTDKLVVVQVKLLKADLCDEKTLARENVACMNASAIHKEWIKQTEENINSAIDGTINDIRNMSMPSSEFGNFVRFLQENKSYFDQPIMMNKGLWKASNLDIALKNQPIWERLLDLSHECMRRNFPNARPPYKEQMGKPEVLNCFRSAYSFFFAGANPNNVALYEKLRILLYKYYAKKLSRNNQAFENFVGAHQAFADKSERERKQRKQESKRENSEVNAPPPLPLIDPMTRDIVKKGENAELELLRSTVVDYYIEKYTHATGERNSMCKSFYGDKLTEFEDKSLSCIAHLEKSNCHDVDYCRVRVLASIPGLVKRDMCPESEPGRSKNCPGMSLRKRFEGLLKFEEAYYSYAITPKESAQRVLSVSSEQRQKQLALSLIAKSAGQLDAESLGLLASSLSESRTQIEQIQRKPLVLSFGRGQPTLTRGKKKAAAAIDSSTHPGDQENFESNDGLLPKPQEWDKGIDFGWFIGPKYVVSNGGDLDFVHAPVQYSLSAVISVPSWWTTLNLRVDTCWIEKDEITELEKAGNQSINKYIDAICDSPAVESSHDNTLRYVVKLPGSTSELPRKFGYEIERVPSIQNTGSIEPLADFFIGQEDASLIINGDELWRSTVVTMGNQKATSIEVLPNMKGIIARFDEVRTPDRKIVYQPDGASLHLMDDCVIISEVFVWTSEGKTEKPLYVRIHPNPDAQAGDKKAPPHGFGDCDYTKPEQEYQQLNRQQAADSKTSADSETGNVSGSADSNTTSADSG